MKPTWDFLSNDKNLATITPESTGFEITSNSEGQKDVSGNDYNL